MRSPEKTSEITMPLNHALMVGDPVDISGCLYIIVGLRHDIGGSFATSSAQVVEPGWMWKMKFRFKRFVRRLMRTVARTWRQYRADRADRADG